MAFKLGMTIHLWLPYYARAWFHDFDLDASSQWIRRGKQSASNYLDNNKYEGDKMDALWQHIQLAWLQQQFLHDLDFEIFTWLDHLALPSISVHMLVRV